MRRITFSVLAGILLLFAPTLFLWLSREARAVNIPINVKDLPEYGLKLIAPTDPSFKGKLSALAKNKAYPLAEDLSYYSVLLENKGGKAIVGYRLKWEMIKADGSVSVRQAGGFNMGAFMYEGLPGLENLSSDGFALKSASIAFVSPVGSLSEEGSGTITGYARGSADPAALDQFRQNIKDKHFPSLVDNVISDLQNYSSITVSFDGVFFQDGTFVGPDTTGFFSAIEARIDAKRELLQEIAFAVQRKRSLDEIFIYIEEIAGSPPPNRRLNQSDLYNFYKKMEAEDVLRMKTATNGQRAVEMLLQQYRKAWPKLKKS